MKECKRCQIYFDCTQMVDAKDCGMYWGFDEKLDLRTGKLVKKNLKRIIKNE